MSRWTKTLADAAGELGLKRMGNEYHGPCPVCGGNDRFWLAKGRSHDILATCRQGCGFGEIAKELISRGLMLRDEDYQRPVYRQEDLDAADFAVVVAESDLRSGRPVQARDRQFIAGLVGRVDQRRKEALMGVLDKMRRGYE